jgi:hypothetical protein
VSVTASSETAETVPDTEAAGAAEDEAGAARPIASPSATHPHQILGHDLCIAVRIRGRILQQRNEFEISADVSESAAPDAPVPSTRVVRLNSPAATSTISRSRPP